MVSKNYIRRRRTSEIEKNYPDKQHKIMIDLLANELEVSREKADEIFKRQEDSL